MASLAILIPARGEGVRVDNLLVALLCDAGALTLQVVVALNGEHCEAERERLLGCAAVFARMGHRLEVIAVAAGGKCQALNAAERLVEAGPRLYLDADVMLMPGALETIRRALDDPQARLVGPVRAVVAPATGFARSVERLWSRLPGMRGFIGGGAYAVNAAGRERWGAFPDIVADDAFVFSLFAPHERALVGPPGIWVDFAEGWDLVRSYRRWRDGNAALGMRATGRERWAVLGLLLREPALWRDLPAFVALKLAARWGADPQRTRHAWLPQRGATRALPVRRPRVRVVGHAGGAVASRWCELVSDGGDVEADLADYVVIAGPREELRAATIDRLVAFACHRPQAGAYADGAVLMVDAPCWARCGGDSEAAWRKAMLAGALRVGGG